MLRRSSKFENAALNLPSIGVAGVVELRVSLREMVVPPVWSWTRVSAEAFRANFLSGNPVSLDLYGSDGLIKSRNQLAVRLRPDLGGSLRRELCPDISASFDY